MKTTWHVVIFVFARVYVLASPLSIWSTPSCPLLGDAGEDLVNRATAWCFIRDQIYNPSLTRRSLILQLPEVFTVPREQEVPIPVNRDPLIHPVAGTVSLWTLKCLFLGGVCFISFWFCTSLAANETSSAQLKAYSSWKAYFAGFWTVNVLFILSMCRGLNRSPWELITCACLGQRCRHRGRKPCMADGHQSSVLLCPIPSCLSL